MDLMRYMRMARAARDTGVVAPITSDVFSTETGGSTTTFSRPDSGVYTSGNICFVLIFSRPATSNEFPTNVTVGGGANGTQIRRGGASTNNAPEIWRCTAGSGGDVVITNASGTTNAYQVNVLQFAAAQIGATDQNNSGSQSSVTTIASPPSITPSQASELVLAICCDSSFANGAGGELDGPLSGGASPEFTQTMEQDTDATRPCVAGYRVISSTTACTANLTSSVSTSLQAVIVSVRLN